MGEEIRIESVKIVHHDLHSGEYRLLADFFRLVGSFVCECTLKENPKEAFDVVIVIKYDVPEEKIKMFEGKGTLAVLDPLDMLQAGPENKKSYIKGCLDKIFYLQQGMESGSQVSDREELNRLRAIADVYVEHQIMESRCSSMYLYEQRDVVINAQLRYAEAYKRIRKLSEETNRSSRYVEFARLDLARLLNETNNLLDEIPVFSCERLLESAERLEEKHRGFCNVCVLQGMIAELSVYTKNKAAEYYKQALDEMDGRPYASYANYRLGRFYEKERRNWDAAMVYYEQSSRLNPYGYRILFKMGMYYRERGNDRKAIECFYEICRQLKGREAENYLQQREYEYLYKSYQELGGIYEEQGRYEDAADAYEHSIQIIEKTKKKPWNRLYREIFGEDAERYLVMLEQRWPLDEVWKHLVQVYDYLGKEDKSEQVRARFT